VFAEAGGMPALRARSLVLTSYLEALLRTSLPALTETSPGAGDGLRVGIITPSDPEARGAQLSLSFAGCGGVSVRDVFTRLQREGVVVDIREVRVRGVRGVRGFTHPSFTMRVLRSNRHRLFRRPTSTNHPPSTPPPQPHAMRVAPAPLYNTPEDVWAFVETLAAVLREIRAGSGGA
jgi:kynureninase